ncbi:MAG: DUF2589 domain-containing protein [Planctomycetota bacterium]
MPTPGQELASLDFESMIGGPLRAVVASQAQSSLTSVDFIKQVGFDDNGDVLTTEFNYEKEVEDDQGVTSTAKHKLTVPLLTILPIPFLRVEETTIDFNAKISSTQYNKTTSQHDFSASLEAKASWLWGSAKLKASYSYKKKNEKGSETERTYTMKVHVRAIQDELPPGMERVLNVLENSIKDAAA